MTSQIWEASKNESSCFTHIPYCMSPPFQHLNYRIRPLLRASVKNFSGCIFGPMLFLRQQANSCLSLSVSSVFAETLTYTSIFLSFSLHYLSIISKPLLSSLLMVDSICFLSALLKYNWKKCVYLKCTAWRLHMHMSCQMIATIRLIHRSKTVYLRPRRAIRIQEGAEVGASHM